LTRNVKGVLFADYVRMIRALKDPNLSRDLEPDDILYLVRRIEPDAWYPMKTFERLGNAILRDVAKGDLEAVRMWGRVSVDPLRAKNPDLVAPENPVETLMRFRVFRSTYFDFEALSIATLIDGHAEIVIHYHMGAMAEEAASFQTMGFFERLLEIAGAATTHARFRQRSWAGDARTLLQLDWSMPER
jgi:hypothetical protein